MSLSGRGWGASRGAACIMLKKLEASGWFWRWGAAQVESWSGPAPLLSCANGPALQCEGGGVSLGGGDRWVSKASFMLLL